MKIFSKNSPVLPIVFFLLISQAKLFGADLTIRGQVKVSPPWPEASIIPVAEQHQATCGPTKQSPKIQIAEDGGLANALVSLDNIAAPKEWKGPMTDFILDQINCEFSPHVLLVPPKAILTILNSDAMLHNVRSFDRGARMLFNDAMPMQGQSLKKKFEEPGRYVVRCGVHPWMHAIVIVPEHRYYTLTDRNGYFVLNEISAASARFHVWHETLGDLSLEVKLPVDSITLTYPPRPSRE